MANVQNNSNANSSLVNTMLGSDSLMNPNIYSTAEIAPPHALTYSPMDPSNGSVVADGTTTSFQINKYGIISQILFSFEKQKVSAADGDVGTTSIPVNDVFSVIDKVELLSSSRVISTLTRYDLMAQFSSLPQDTFTCIDEGCIKARDVVTAAGARTNSVKFTIPLVFGFMLKQNTQLNASFLEPLSIKVYYGKTTLPTVTNNVISVINPKLMVRYKNYQEEATAKILAENFSNPTLNMLLCRYYDENRSSVVVTSSTAALTTLQVELKNTDCVEDFYYVLVKSQPGSAGGAAPGAYQNFTPQPITNLKFSGSGQEFCNLDEAQLNYGRIGSYGFSHALSTTAGGSDLSNIKSFQTGIYDEHVVSNTMSLREINNPLVEVQFLAKSDTDTAPTEYSLYVVEKCSSIYSVNSATGSLSISLSN